MKPFTASVALATALLAVACTSTSRTVTTSASLAPAEAARFSWKQPRGHPVRVHLAAVGGRTVTSTDLGGPNGAINLEPGVHELTLLFDTGRLKARSVVPLTVLAGHDYRIETRTDGLTLTFAVRDKAPGHDPGYALNPTRVVAEAAFPAPWYNHQQN